MGYSAAVAFVLFRHYPKRRDLVARLGRTVGAMRAQTIAVRVLRCTALALTLFPLAWSGHGLLRARGRGGRLSAAMALERARLDQYRTLFSRLGLAR